MNAWWILGPLAAATALYALHRLALHLKKPRDPDYWDKMPAGGSGYNPLQELVQPQIRHVIEATEHRVGEDREGAPRLPPPPRATLGDE